MKSSKQQHCKIINNNHRQSNISHTSKKSVNQKQKICNIIKKSSLLKTKSKKSNKKNKQSRSSSVGIMKQLNQHINIYNLKNKNTKKIPYNVTCSNSTRKKDKQVSHQKLEVNKMSNTCPLKYNLTKQKQKLLQFPFNAIRFKDHKNKENHNLNNINSNQPNIIINKTINENQNYSKTHNNFYIQYDEFEIDDPIQQVSQDIRAVDMKLIENSKNIIGSYNQRISRYNKNDDKRIVNQKYSRKEKPIFNHNHRNDVNIEQFHKAICILFKFLDISNKGSISKLQIEKRKLSQTSLYFVGSIFQKIRQKNLLLTFKQFELQCDYLYQRSSKNDIQWFIKEINQINNTTSIGEDVDLENTNIQNSLKLQKNLMRGRQEIQEKAIMSSQSQRCKQQKRFSQNTNNHNNISFDQESSVISFRKKHPQIKNILASDDRQQMGYESSAYGDFNNLSYQSAKFCTQSQSQGRNSLNINNSNQEFRFDSFNPNKQFQNKNQHQSSIHHQNKDPSTQVLKSSSKYGEIKKNIILNHPQDLRQQIYSKMNKMKIDSILDNNKENTSTKNNFDLKIKQQQRNIINSLGVHNNLLDDNFRKYDQAIKGYVENRNKLLQSSSKQKIPLGQIPLVSNTVNISSLHTSKPISSNLNKQSLLKQSSLSSSTQKWIPSNKACQNTYTQMQKLKQQFNKHKQLIQKRQSQRQNYFKDQLKKIQTKISQGTMIDSRSRINDEEESRIVRIFGKNSQNLNTNSNLHAMNVMKKKFDCNNLDNSSYNNDMRGDSVNVSGSKLISSFHQYEPNINRLSNLIPKPASTLVNSCRKSVEISLPLQQSQQLKQQQQQRQLSSSYSLSQKKSLSQQKYPLGDSYGKVSSLYGNKLQKIPKLDKIDELSQKIQEYLKKNAQKISVSKNYTEKSYSFLNENI